MQLNTPCDILDVLRLVCFVILRILMLAPGALENGLCRDVGD
jgi:hypothetical protein